jgi:hypothetical protein
MDGMQHAQVSKLEDDLIGQVNAAGFAGQRDDNPRPFGRGMAAKVAALEAERDQLAERVAELAGELAAATADRDRAQELAERSDAQRVRVAERVDGLGRHLD